MFDGEKGVLRNQILPFGLNAIIAKVYKGDSWLDGKECIVLDYSDTSLVAQWIRDEIREIQPKHVSGQGLLGQAAADRLRAGVQVSGVSARGGKPKMTPQSTFMVVAPIADGRRAELRGAAGHHEQRRPAWPIRRTRLVPFGSFDRLHFARFVILDPQTLGDIGVYGGQPPPWTAVAGVPGRLRRRRGRVLVDELVGRRPSPGCAASSPIAATSGRARTCAHWMLAHAARPTASYVNWIGRTVRQIREEAALREALIGRARELGGESSPVPPAAAARPSCSSSCAPRRPPAADPEPRGAHPAGLARAQPGPPDRRARSRSSSWRRFSCRLARAAVPAALARDAPTPRSRPACRVSGSASWPRRRTTTSPTSSAPWATSSPAGSAAGW